eukprot:1337363-Rhodomonas_salina.1
MCLFLAPARHVMSGTESRVYWYQVFGGLTTRGSASPTLQYLNRSISYESPTPCPVLTKRTVLPGPRYQPARIATSTTTLKRCASACAGSVQTRPVLRRDYGAIRYIDLDLIHEECLREAMECEILTWVQVQTRATALRARYAMSGTDVDCGAIRSTYPARLHSNVPVPLCSYVLAMPCPVLTYATALPVWLGSRYGVGLAGQSVHHGKRATLGR